MRKKKKRCAEAMECALFKIGANLYFRKWCPNLSSCSPLVCLASKPSQVPLRYCATVKLIDISRHAKLFYMAIRHYLQVAGLWRSSKCFWVQIDRCSTSAPATQYWWYGVSFSEFRFRDVVLSLVKLTLRLSLPWAILFFFFFEKDFFHIVDVPVSCSRCSRRHCFSQACCSWSRQVTVQSMTISNGRPTANGTQLKGIPSLEVNEWAAKMPTALNHRRRRRRLIQFAPLVGRSQWAQ